MQDLYSVELDKRPYRPRSEQTLHTLLGEALDGSQEAWQELWEHGLRMVLKIVNKLEQKELLRIDREEAISAGNAAIGEALLTWIPKKGKYATWVWVNIRHAILSANAQEILESLTGEDGEDLLEGIEVANVYEDPESDAFLRSTKERIESFPPDIREVLWLHVWESLSLSEIAQMYGVSRQRIQQIYQKGIAELRDSYSV